MCGIAGIVGAGAREEVVADMIGRIAHRGPDGRSTVAGDRHALGHARLAIIDLVTGQQPMVSASGRYVLVFNGEIYNFRELKAEIGARYVFRTTSDTEVILAAVEVLGVERALQCIDGMFAIALVDREEGTLHLARDHFGIKPLYYAASPQGGLAFASEMKALVAAGVSMPIDLVAVCTQLLCRFIPAPHTGRQGVRKLRPGEWRRFTLDGRALDDGRHVIPRAMTDRLGTGADASVETVAQLMAGAIQRQTVSDVPIGMLLSGGVDSAVVTQFAREVNADLHTYCVGYDAGDRATEFAEAAATAARLGTVHRNVVVDAADYAEAMRHAIWHLEEPVATTSLISFSLLCKAVVQERKVVLSGQGADEPWGGYTRHRFEALRADFGPMLRAAAPVLAAWPTLRPRLREILRNLDDEQRRWVAYRSLFPMERLAHTFGRDTLDAALSRIADALAWADGQQPDAERDDFSRLLVRDSFTDLSDNLLLLSDKLSMAHSLEVRVPLLDVAYASHVLRLPMDAKRAGRLRRQGKALHKAVAERTLPAEIVHRPKKGFETPLNRWLSQELGQSLVRRLLAPDAALRRHLDVHALLGGEPAPQAAGHELQQQLFSLWLMDEWMDMHR